jgi:hypothetical protein
MFAAMAALNRRKTTLNPTTSGICLMMGSLLTRAAESNVRQGVAAVTKKRGTEARALVLVFRLQTAYPHFHSNGSGSIGEHLTRS